MRINLLLVLILLQAVIGFPPLSGQTDREPPLSPVLMLVSVNQSTGNPELRWELSPSPDVAGYVVYSFRNGEGYAIDTLKDPMADTFVHFGSGASFFRESYVVSAFDNNLNISPLSNEIGTMHASALIDTCSGKIHISWNSYPSFPYKVTGYRILYSALGGSFSEAGSTAPDVFGFTIDDFVIDSDYCFIVEAILDGIDRTSVSNKACINTRMQRPPGWINADYASVTAGNAIDLSFTIDPSSEITLFQLEKNNARSDGFQKIALLSSDLGMVRYTDNQTDPGIVNTYRLSAVNNCGIALVTSNLASSVVLDLQRSGNDIRLTWNSYRKWMGAISGYTLLIDTGNGFAEKATIHPPDTSITIRYSDLMYEVTGPEICFAVSAQESANPYLINGSSMSNSVCTEVTENIVVPNIFTPDGDGINELFRPVLSFTPSAYHLTISDKSGRAVFESDDHTESWDGSKGGNPLPQGVYLWFLKVTTPSGKPVSRTGNVTIFKNR
jgi:gliding motility-associated-like protein